MGFRPAYSTREALLDYISAQRLRDARLMHEPGERWGSGSADGASEAGAREDG